ncbi:hypothetical protein [Streptomyces daliensis]|nr:hypothetical protein [Streptomyces daliensis]
MSLPRTYWCHVDYTDPDGLLRGPLSECTSYPGIAVTWLRETVRTIAFPLDHETFGVVWAWLGDHTGADAAVDDLRCGRPYDVRVGAGLHQWTLHARPVSLLPLASSCPGTWS